MLAVDPITYMGRDEAATGQLGYGNRAFSGVVGLHGEGLHVAPLEYGHCMLVHPVTS
ncbi:MAG: hypothetical protein WC340_19145 [Kiritimatiellia bacterium]